MQYTNNYDMGAKMPNLTILCDDPIMAMYVTGLAEIGNISVTKSAPIGDWVLNRNADDAIACDAICIDLRAEMDGTDGELSELGLYCQRYGTRLVVVTDLERIDALYGRLPEHDVQFVIGNDPGAMLLALTTATRGRKMGTLFDHKKDQTSPALSKISAELAEFARALSRIAQAEQDGEIGVDFLADKPRSYMAPVGNFMPFHSVHASQAETTLDPAKIRNLIRVRRLRDRFFDAELFADPAWDILLDLMAARIEGTKVSVSSLCIAAAVPATTALRWIKSMTDGGYLERRADPTDARRVYIHLSDDAARKLAQYMHAREELSGL